MTLAFHVCRRKATDVAATNNGVGRHQARFESTYVYKSLPIKRESVDTELMMVKACTGASARINPTRADSHSLNQRASIGRFLAASGNQRLNPEETKAQLRETSQAHILPSLSTQNMGDR
jgi:hypothetical protein